MTLESSGSNASEPEEPLSATAMFLRSLEEPAAAPKQETGWPAAAQAPVAPGASGPVSSTPVFSAPEPAKQGPGEFTQMFQAIPSAAPRQEQAFGAAPPPAASGLGGSNAGQSAGPGEFTRIFQAGAVSPEAKTVIEPPPYAAPVQPPAGTPSRKGFSAPGVSDSASGEGSVTQIFKPVQASPSMPPPVVSSPAVPAAGGSSSPPAQPFMPAGPYVPEATWKSEPEFGGPSQPGSGTSVTALLSTLAGPSAPHAGRMPEPAPYAPAPVPAFTPAPMPETTPGPEAGSVTRLIQRLAQAPPEPPPQAFTPTPAASSGPGEFTRMISAGAFAPAAASPPPPPPTAAPLPGMPAFSMPPPAMPQIPHAQPAAPAMHMPKPEMPKPPAMAMPAAPAVAAPKGKLDGLVPVLLIVNTFLLVLILVVVLFALKGH